MSHSTSSKVFCRKLLSYFTQLFPPLNERKIDCVMKKGKKKEYKKKKKETVYY